ncbi:MAG: hypothetical protein MK171_06555 [Pirellulales bacterium]|nr:hypothetical protein [Pirellulales bacterium]
MDSIVSDRASVIRLSEKAADHLLASARKPLRSLGARQLSDRIGQAIVAASAASAGEVVHLMRKVPTPISKLGRAVVGIFHNEKLDQKIRVFFGSYYRIQ